MYRFHTPEKIKYDIYYMLDADGNGDIYAGANALWGEEYGLPNYPGCVDYTVDGSVSGEVIIADLYKDIEVEVIMDFRSTQVMSFVFPNKIRFIRNEMYTGDNFFASYVVNSKTINLYFDEFNREIMYGLVHSFFHYYFYVLALWCRSVFNR